MANDRAKLKVGDWVVRKPGCWELWQDYATSFGPYQVTKTRRGGEEIEVAGVARAWYAERFDRVPKPKRPVRPPVRTDRAVTDLKDAIISALHDLSDQATYGKVGRAIKTLSDALKAAGAGTKGVRK